MNPNARPGSSALILALALAGFGCGDATTATDITETPPKVLNPTAPDETATTATATATAAPAGEVALVPIKYDAMRARISAKKARLTMVDAWATWCAPCKENFPHVVEMNAKYAGQGLAVVSLSLDDPTDGAALGEAAKFLREQKAVFTNFVLDEEQEAAFEKLNISGIPAVFLFGPDGKELKRYTMDDPDNQFTYEQVEKDVAAMLKGEPLPGSDKAAR